MLHRDYESKCSIKKRMLVVGLKGLAAQDEWIDDKPPVVQ
jgi:hypothetical protein